jgi:AP-1 complex subunit gamma-1
MFFNKPLILAGLEDALPSITAFQSATLKIVFDLRKQLGKPQETTIHATFTNLTSTTYTDFIFQAAVPKVTSWCFILYSMFELFV